MLVTAKALTNMGECVALEVPIWDLGGILCSIAVDSMLQDMDVKWEPEQLAMDSSCLTCKQQQIKGDKYSFPNYRDARNLSTNYIYDL